MANLSAFYDLNGLVGTSYGIPIIFHVPGLRYTNSGTCSNPATVASYAVSFVCSAGSTAAGPIISFDDTCSYWGIFGTATYTGTRGTVGICRNIFIKIYSDSSYSTLLQQTQISQNGATYYFVTNDGSNTSGLSTVYMQAYYDANGNWSFDTGDPYLNLGPVTPTTDGLLQNISFGDASIK